MVVMRVAGDDGMAYWYAILSSAWTRTRGAVPYRRAVATVVQIAEAQARYAAWAAQGFPL
jgi:hypothetical protein